MPASINDWGGSSPDTLSNPPLGGPDGWAAAVAAALDQSDVTVDSRLASVASTVPAAITDHEAKPDPHPQYLKPSEIVAGANITVTENAGAVTIAGQAGGGGGDVTVAHAAPTEPPARDGLLWVVVPA